MDRKTIENKLQEVAEKIIQDFQPDKIILFGSWAWGDPNPDSDVDLFIVKETANTRQLAREIDGSIFPRPFPLDIVVNHPDDVEKRSKMGDFFIRDILSRGKILYAR